MRTQRALVVALALLAACTTDVNMYAMKNTTSAERTFAASYLALLAGGRIDSAVALLAPALRSDTTRRIAATVGVLLSRARLDSLHFIAVHINENLGTHERQTTLSYEAPTSDSQWVAASVATNYRGDTANVVGFSAYPVAEQLETTNAFTLTHRSPIHFIWLALALLMPICTIGCAVWIVRSRMPRRWLWAVVALITSPAMALNWTTGQLTGQLNLFLLFGGSGIRGVPAAPWIISFGVPLGAIVSYFRLRAWRQAASDASKPSGVAA